MLAIPTAVMLACGGGDDDNDAGNDATVDSPTVDTGVDSTVDSGKDAGLDSGDASLDSGDASVDAEPDAADASDASDVSDATDSGLGDAGDAAVDAGLDDAGCGAKLGFGSASVDAGCVTGEAYTCGANEYTIECRCSPGICGCTKNDASIPMLFNYAGCPTCSMTPDYTSLAAGCMIPY